MGFIEQPDPDPELEELLEKEETMVSARSLVIPTLASYRG